MTNGYFNKMLRINLSEGIFKQEPIPEEVCRKYIGGSGFGVKLLMDELAADCDPLGPENKLIFAVGPFLLSGVIESGKHAVICKSPQTGILAESDSGGFWGAMFKRTGYDMLILEGRTPKLSYIWLTDYGVEIRDATHLRGADTYDCYYQLREETHEKAEISCIGPAAENGCVITGIFNDGREGRAAGRCGVGAVMASKNIKAVAVYGTKRPEIYDKAGLTATMREVVPIVVAKGAGMGRFGTGGGVIGIEKSGDLPIKNWSLGNFEEGAVKTSGQALAEKYLIKQYKCFNCVIGCGRHIQVNEGRFASLAGGGPEYETLGYFGGNILMDDLAAICMANELCNRYGIDTISAGNVIGFALECFEKGMISEADTGGIPLKWGDPDTVMELLRQISDNVHLGRIIGQGVYKAAEIIGQGSMQFAVHVKGLEPAAHDPRAYSSLGIGYATSNRGACHLQAFSHAYENAASMPDIGIPEPLERFTPVGKAYLSSTMQNCMSMCDALKLCKFGFNCGITPTIMSNWLSLITGWEYTREEFLLTGERLFNLKRLFNLRCGITAADDTLPPRLLNEKRGSGGAADHLPDLDYMLRDYYQLRGWDQAGAPTWDKLNELGLIQYYNYNSDK